MQLSERVSKISVSATMRVAAEAERLRAHGIDVVDFGAGEPDFPTPDNVKQAAIRAIECNFTRYTAAGGTQELREAVCARHHADFGTHYHPSECVITPGGKYALFDFIQVLVDPGDEVIVPAPSWVTFQEIVRYSGGTCVFVETSEQNGFTLTAAMVEAKITPRTKMVIVNSPNNPSGAIFARAEFEKLCELTASRHVYLLSDECYCQFVYDGEPYSIASAPHAKDTVLVAGSLSKTYAMTGWRIGFGLAPEKIIQATVKLQGHSTSNPNSIAQKAAVEALRGPQDSVREMLAEYRRRRDFVVSRLGAIPGLTCAQPSGAFYAYPNIGRLFGRNGIANTIDFAERLLHDVKVAVVPGEAFGTSQHIRISYATSMKELERGLDRIQAFVEPLAR